MRRSPPPTEADITSLLDAVFKRCEAENKFPQLISSMINKLSDTDPATAMVVIGILLDEAVAMLPDRERTKLMSEFAQLANSH